MTNLNLLEIQTSMSPNFTDFSWNQFCFFFFIPLMWYALLSRTILWETTIIKPFVRQTKLITCSPQEEPNYRGDFGKSQSSLFNLWKERPSQALPSFWDLFLLRTEVSQTLWRKSLLSTLSQEPPRWAGVSSHGLSPHASPPTLLSKEIWFYTLTQLLP